MANTNILAGQSVQPFGGGGLISRLVDHDGPSSYSTNGETLNAADLGMKQIIAVFCMLSLSKTYSVWPYISLKGQQSSAKLLWATRSSQTEVTSLTDLSAESVKLLVIGIPA